MVDRAPEKINMDHRPLTTKDVEEIIDAKIANLATKQDIENIVARAMVDSLLKVGRGTKTVIITLAVIIGALGVITGGFKWLLAAIGLSVIKHS